MATTIHLSEADIHRIVESTVRKYLGETSRRQKAQGAVMGHNPKVRTMCIISAENPMGQKADAEYNKASTDELIRNLRVGNFMYFRTKGLYGSPENSVIVYNISLDDALYLCYRYNQESVVFIERTADGVSYQYWEGDDHTSRLKLQHERHEVVDATNDTDFWTQISRKFKFRIPFFEHVSRIEGTIRENCPDEAAADRMIDECLSDKYVGGHKHVNRFKLYGPQTKRTLI